MKRTTVKLDDELDARVRTEAMRRGLTVSEWTREALAAHLPGESAGQGRPRRTFRGAGIGASGRSDISERIEELMTDMLLEDRQRERTRGDTRDVTSRT